MFNSISFDVNNLHSFMKLFQVFHQIFKFQDFHKDLFLIFSRLVAVYWFSSPLKSSGDLCFSEDFGENGHQ